MNRQRSKINNYEKQPVIIHKRIGMFTRELRLNEGLTQNDAASQIGISKGCLQRVEYGENFTISTLIMIASFFEIPISFFFDDLD